MVCKSLGTGFCVIDSDLSIRIKKKVLLKYSFLLLWYLDSRYVQAPGHCMNRMGRQCLLCSLVGVLQVTQAKSTVSLVVSVDIITRGYLDINRQHVFLCIDPYIHTQT